MKLRAEKSGRRAEFRGVEWRPVMEAHDWWVDPLVALSLDWRDF